MSKKFYVRERNEKRENPNPQGIVAGDYVQAIQNINRKGETVVSVGEVYEVLEVNDDGFLLIVGDSGKKRWVHSNWGLQKFDDDFAAMFA